MYVVDVIALSPTSPAEPLSYRSKESLPLGTIVSVLLRSKPVHGIIVGSTNVMDAKSLLKTASFALAKSVTKSDGMLPYSLMKAAQNIALYHAVPLGSVLHAVLSDTLATDLPRVLPQGEGFSKNGIEFPLRERLRKYRHIVENSDDAVLLIVPTLAELAELRTGLSDLSPLVLSGELKPEARKAALDEAVLTKGLVLATPAFSFVGIRTLSHIIIERPSAGTYRMPRRPSLDRVQALLALAEARAVPISLGDYPLPLEHREKPERPLFARPEGTVEAVDVRTPLTQGEVWKTIPDAVLKSIRQTLKENGRVLVLSARRGYAPSVVCRDCGTSVKDERGLAYTLVIRGETRLLKTSDGKSVSTADVVCTHCGSWNLLPLGVGIERVLEELQSAFPEEAVTRFDADVVKTGAAARKAMKQFNEKRGILVGTESMLPWLGYGDKEYDLAVIASIDSLLALPFWRARERFVRIALILAEHAKHTILQTRLPEDTALSAVLTPKETTFFQEETQLRRALGYPPFSVLIAVTSQGTQKKLLEGKIALMSASLPHAPTFLSEKLLPKNVYQQTAILKLPKDTWPDGELSRKLQQLPPFMRVSIDPESFS